MITKPVKYTLQNILKETVRKYRDKLAFSFKDDTVTFTYGEVADAVKKVSFFLQRNGIKRYDKIAILGENMPQWGISYYSIANLGGVSVPVLIGFSPKEILNILKHSESKAIFISEKIYKKIKNDLNYDGIIIIMDTLTYAKDGKSIDQYWEENINKVPLFENYEVRESDLACLIYTSGTTGMSKGVMLTHENLVWDAYQCTTIEPVDETYIYLSVLPLAHTYECTLELILGVMQGATIYYLDKAPTARVLMPLFEKYRPTIILTVPLIIEKIYNMGVKPNFSKGLVKHLYNIRPFQILFNRIAGKKLFKKLGGRIKFFGIGGSAVSPEVERFLLDAKFPYSCGYGLTETSPMIFGAQVHKTKYKSVGPVMEGIEYKLIDVNTLTGEGEVAVRGRNVMTGYYKNPEITKDVLDNDGWFKTGDLGIIDKKDGYLYLKGRSKNMILGSNGENIYPEEIEATLNKMNDVEESVVYENKGKIEAQVYIDQEKFIKRFQELKESAAEMREKLDQYLEEIKAKVNESVKKEARIARIYLKSKPFDKTATFKIKRFLINKDHKEKKSKKDNSKTKK